MNKINLLCVSIAISILIAGCGINTSPKVGNFPNDSVRETDISEAMVLPGIDRTVFDESLRALGPNIDCKIEPSGPSYREQTLVQPDFPVNYFKGSVKLPAPLKFKSGITGGRVAGHVYLGGDTAGTGGALDAGFQSDINVGGYYWKPFIKNGTSSLENDRATDGFRYRINANETVDVAMFIDKSNKIHFLISGRLLKFNSADTTAQLISTSIEIVQPSVPGTWSYSGLRQSVKNMTTFAVDYPIDYSTDGTQILQPAMWDINSMAVGYRTQQEFDSNLKDLRIFVKKPNSKDKAWSEYQYGQPCFKPSDMVKPSSNNSAEVSLRVKSVLEYKLLPTSKNGNVINGKLSIKNAGPNNSKLYYDVVLPSSAVARDVILAEQVKNLPYSYTCPNVSKEKIVTLFYSRNETFDATNKNKSVRTPAQPGPPFVKDYYGKDGTAFVLDIPGSLLFRTEKITIPLNCTKQSFQIPPTTLTALVNQSTPETTQNLTVLSDSATVSGQYIVGPKAALAAQSIIVNADPVTPVIPTPFQTKDLLVTVKPIKCGPTAGTNAPLNSTISDPTGNTDPTDYAVTVRCVGPAISDPAPNPLNLSGTVGSPVSGTFTFQNVGEVVGGAQAPLTFSLSPSAGLTASAAPASPLAGGGTETVTVGATCEVAGTKTYTVTITSDDPLKPSVVETVNVTCIGEPDIKVDLSGLKYEGDVGNPVENSSFSILNEGLADLNIYRIYTSYFYFSDYTKIVHPGETITVKIPMRCGSIGMSVIDLFIESDDPDEYKISVPVKSRCSGPLAGLNQVYAGSWNPAELPCQWVDVNWNDYSSFHYSGTDCPASIPKAQDMIASFIKTSGGVATWRSGPYQYVYEVRGTISHYYYTPDWP